MSKLKQEIFGLIVSASTDLEQIDEYYRHTKEAFRVIQAGVQRDDLEFTISIASTGSTLNQTEFSDRLQEYLTEMLLPDVLRRVVTTCEEFLFDCYKAWLIQFPKRMQSRQIAYNTVLAAQSLDEIKDHLASKVVDDLKYDRPANWFSKFKDDCGWQELDDALVGKFAEIKARRDLYIHGTGFSNEIYLRKAGSYAATDKVGEYLEVTEPYYRHAYSCMFTIVKNYGAIIENHAPQ